MDQSLEVELGDRLEVSDKKAECRFFDELDFKSEDALVDFRILVGILKREGKQLEGGRKKWAVVLAGWAGPEPCSYGCNFRDMGWSWAPQLQL